MFRATLSFPMIIGCRWFWLEKPNFLLEILFVILIRFRRELCRVGPLFRIRRASRVAIVRSGEGDVV